jgi:uncharacterized protein YjbJ (UPF0337 family)
MDWNRVEGNWKQLKGSVKEQWGKLTDDDLDVIKVAEISSKARSRGGTATRRIRSAGRWTTGTIDRGGDQHAGESNRALRQRFTNEIGAPTRERPFSLANTSGGELATERTRTSEPMTPPRAERLGQSTAVAP